MHKWVKMFTIFGHSQVVFIMGVRTGVEPRPRVGVMTLAKFLKPLNNT